MRGYTGRSGRVEHIYIYIAAKKKQQYIFSMCDVVIVHRQMCQVETFSLRGMWNALGSRHATPKRRWVCHGKRVAPESLAPLRVLRSDCCRTNCRCQHTSKGFIWIQSLLLVASLLLVVRPGAPSSVRSLLVAMPGAPSSVRPLLIPLRGLGRTGC